MRYNAFISYSHKADSGFARAFQRALEQLARPWNRRRALDIFRDETDLSISPELLTSVFEAADRSSYFLLLASPQAASSKWVGHEVEHWVSGRGCSKLLIILTSGELVWDDDIRDFDWSRTDALPPGLRGKFAAEPLWVDFRWAAGEPNLTLNDERFRDSVATVAAELHGMSKRDLVGEDLRQHQKLLRVKRIAQVSGTVLLLAVLVATYFAVQQRRRAEQRRITVLTQQLASDSMRVVDDQPSLIDLGVLLAAESVRRQPLLDNDKAIRRALALRPKPVPYHAAGVTAIAFSADSQIAAMGGEAGAVDIVELRSGRVLRRIPVPSSVKSLALSPHGELAAAGDDGVIRIYNISDGSRLRELPVADTVGALAFSPDGNQLAAGVDHSVRFVETRDWTVIPGLDCEDEVNGLAFSGGQIVVTGNDAAVTCSPRKNARIRSKAADEAPLGKVSALSADGQFRVTCGQLVSVDKNCRVSDVSAGKQVSTLVQQDLVERSVFSPDRRYVGTISRDHSIRVFETRTGRLFSYLRSEAAGRLLFSPDSRYLATEVGERVRLYQLSGENIVRSYPGGRLISAAFSADGRYAAHGGLTEVFDVASGQRVLALEGGRSGRTVALSADARFVAADAPLRVIELNGGREIYRDDITVPLTGLAFSLDSKYLAVATQGSVEFYDLTARKRLFDRPLKEPRAVSLNADGKYLAAAGRSGAVLFSPLEGKELLAVKHQGLAHSVALTPDGRYLASGGTDQQVPVYDVLHNRELCRLIHQETIYSLAFSPDGRYIATGGLDKSVRIFTLPGGEEVARLPQEEAVIGILFEPDGRHVLVAVGRDRSTGPFLIARHLIQPGDLVQEACSRVERNLSREEWARWIRDEPYRKTCPALP